MKKVYLQLVSFLVEVDDFDEDVEKITLDYLNKDHSVNVKGKDHLVKCEQITTYYLEEGSDCGKCSNCGNWTVDEFKHDLREISIGTTHDGKLYCYDCLDSQI
ncbi:hypothetical protein BK121_03335 [Paenibacillus odorifer]|uniref:hypothetical protein n=1 Tax=Paenibacillus odorifer TaxID=189426 RepID=UPI00096E42B2|nr:hypothetical protein [Paenibacillus odorifer]OMC75060.1 hypothetical protein BK121_03335 [Paenibacillus odorifer]